MIEVTVAELTILISIIENFFKKEGNLWFCGRATYRAHISGYVLKVI